MTFISRSFTSATTTTANSGKTFALTIPAADADNVVDVNGKTIKVTITLTNATFDGQTDDAATTQVVDISSVDNSAAEVSGKSAEVPNFTATGNGAVTVTVTSIVVE